LVLIAVTATGANEGKPYVSSIESREANARLLTPTTFEGIGAALNGVSGLLLCGGYDVHPRYYGQEIEPNAGVDTYIERDEMEMSLLRAAIDDGMPILGICRGMQLINVAFGGSLLQHIDGHRNRDRPEEQVKHAVYVSPGSKLGAIIGAGAIYRTNSYHHQGIKEAQRAQSLLASAYHPDDGIIEALESPEYKWILGLQCHLEKEDEVPKGFRKVFDWLVAWSNAYEAGEME